MNEFHARRWAQTMQWQALQRIGPLLWKTSKRTGEPFTLQLFQEEYARANARITPPLPYLPSHVQDKLCPKLDALIDNDAVNVSARSYASRHGSLMTQHGVDVGIFQESIPNVRVYTSLPNLVLSDVARTEGIAVKDVNRADDDEE
eukprot:PhF_6_TR34848/c0_g1_i1/m.50599